MSLGRYIQTLGKIIRRKYSNTPANVFSLRSILELNYPQGSSFRFVLVGANDGVSHDFLYSFLLTRDCAGIAIEPSVDSFQKLVANFEGLKNVRLVNKAVHPFLEETILYKVDPAKLSSLPAWSSGIASLDPLHYQKSGTSAEHIIQEKVKAMHLMDLLIENGITGPLDLFQVDTEGFDLEILKQINFKQLQPKIIRFEYENMSETDTVYAINLLKKQGYYCFYEDVDVIAIKTSQVTL